MEVKAYVDGSYNASTGAYGAGMVLIVNDKTYPISRPGAHPEWASMHNVAGEIQAAIMAANLCTQLNGITSLVIYHDYEGIAKWVTGEWKAKKPATQEYVKYMHSLPFKVSFQWVKGHSNNEFNEMADRLAKQGAGLM